MIMNLGKIGKYLNLYDFCTATTTYGKYANKIDPLPKNPESIEAIKQLNKLIIDPIIDYYGVERFQLTYGFCSRDLKKFLAQKDPTTGKKNGRVDPRIDQHMAHEINRNGNYYCPRLGAACDFVILNVNSDAVVRWIIAHQLPFDSLYFYGKDRPIHISYGPQNKQDIWTFTSTGQPTKKGIDLLINR